MTSTGPLPAPFALVADRSTRLAVELVSRGADLVVVGGTARWLHGPDRGADAWPADLDVAVTDAQVDRLAAALTQLGAIASSTAVRRGAMVTVQTGWCPVDVFVVDEPPAAAGVVVDGCQLAVATWER